MTVSAVAAARAHLNSYDAQAATPPGSEAEVAKLDIAFPASGRSQLRADIGEGHYFEFSPLNANIPRSGSVRDLEKP